MLGMNVENMNAHKSHILYINFLTCNQPRALYDSLALLLFVNFEKTAFNAFSQRNIYQGVCTKISNVHSFCIDALTIGLCASKDQQEGSLLSLRMLTSAL